MTAKPSLPVRIVMARGYAGRVVVTCVGLAGIAELDMSPRLAAALASSLAEALAGLASPESSPRDD